MFYFSKKKKMLQRTSHWLFVMSERALIPFFQWQCSQARCWFLLYNFHNNLEKKRVKCAVFSSCVFGVITVYYQIPIIPSSLDVRCNHLGHLVCRSRHIRAPESPLSVREVAFFRQSGACLSGQTSLVRRRCHRCWCLCDCDWSGCRWCGKVRAKSQGRPRGKGLQNKSHASASRRLDFPLKGKSEAANRSPVRIHGRDAGRAALPGPFTSVLKKQGGEKKKKNLRPRSVQRSGS